MKQVIISGASGYVGQHLLNNLSVGEFKVIALCNDMRKLDKFKDKVIILENKNFFELDMDLDNSFLINLAFPRKNDTKELFDSFRYTYKLYDKCKKLGTNYILNISSQSIYDVNRTREASEDDYLIPYNLYGLAKIYVEEYTKEFAEKNNIKFLNLRLGSVVGPNFEIRINNRMLKSYMNNEKISIDNSEQEYSYIYIDDFTECLTEIIRLSDSIDWNQAINIGSNYKYKADEIYDSIRKNSKFEFSAGVERVDVAKTYKTNKINIDKLIKMTGWEPKFDLDRITKNLLKEEYNS